MPGGPRSPPRPGCIQQERANELMLSVFRVLKPNDEGEMTTLEATLGEQLDQVTPQLNESAVEDPLTLARLRDSLLAYAQLRGAAVGPGPRPVFPGPCRRARRSSGRTTPTRSSRGTSWSCVLFGEKEIRRGGRAVRRHPAGPRGRPGARARRRDRFPPRAGGRPRRTEAEGRGDPAPGRERGAGSRPRSVTDHLRTVAAREDLVSRYQQQTDYAAAARLLEANRTHYLARSAGDREHVRPERRPPDDGVGIGPQGVRQKLGRADDAVQLMKPIVETGTTTCSGPQNPSSLSIR